MAPLVPREGEGTGSDASRFRSHQSRQDALRPKGLVGEETAIKGRICTEPFGCHNAAMRRELTSLAAVLVLVAVGCVSIPPTQSTVPTAPRPSAGQPSSPPSTTGPIDSGQPSTAPTDPSTPGETAAPETSGPSGTPGPGASIDPALALQIDEVIAEVPPIRQLEPLADVPYEFITRQQFQDELIELQFSEVPEETRQAEERMLKRLGLIPDDADLDQLLSGSVRRSGRGLLPSRHEALLHHPERQAVRAQRQDHRFP